MIHSIKNTAERWCGVLYFSLLIHINYLLVELWQPEFKLAVYSFTIKKEMRSMFVQHFYVFSFNTTRLKVVKKRGRKQRKKKLFKKANLINKKENTTRIEKDSNFLFRSLKMEWIFNFSGAHNFSVITDFWEYRYQL